MFKPSIKHFYIQTFTRIALQEYHSQMVKDSQLYVCPFTPNQFIVYQACSQNQSLLNRLHNCVNDSVYILTIKILKMIISHLKCQMYTLRKTCHEIEWKPAGAWNRVEAGWCMKSN